MKALDYTTRMAVATREELDLGDRPAGFKLTNQTRAQTLSRDFLRDHQRNELTGKRYRFHGPRVYDLEPAAFPSLRGARALAA